ncbi:sigma-70 region 4 domain-containing protein [Microlunatus endophyticus]|uniref:sigma-70 region 4 domain-containing protein n=1 Tax=Microlunatus endophyticus TaxID=1716077 RepID=UPI0016634E78|nr:sigma-70 region 4 domain-containing protein [Microlunatus endophyticus]
MARDYLAGLSIKEVADKHQVSRPLVRRALAKEGIARRPTRQPDPKRELAILRLRDDLDLSWAEIAEIIGASSTTAQRHHANATPAPLCRSGGIQESGQPPADMFACRKMAIEIAADSDLDPEPILRHFRDGELTGRRRNRPRALPLSDVELCDRHAAGETYRELAAVCGVSPALIWRRVNVRSSPAADAP